MAEVLLVPVGAITAADRKALRTAGVVVVETDDPSKCQFVRSTETLSSSDMLWAAMDALRRDFGSYSTGKQQREQLAHNIYALIATDFSQRHGDQASEDAL